MDALVMGLAIVLIPLSFWAGLWWGARLPALGIQWAQQVSTGELVQPPKAQGLGPKAEEPPPAPLSTLGKWYGFEEDEAKEPHP